MSGSPETEAETRGVKLGGLSGIVAGVLSIAFFASLVISPETGTPAQAMAAYGSNSAIFAIIAILSILFTIFLLPFVTALRNALKRKDRILATAGATFVFLGAILFSVIASVTFGTLVALSNAYAGASSQDRSTILLIAQAVMSLTFSMLWLALAFVSAGLIAFAPVMFKSGTFPNWLAYFSALVGAVGFLALPLFFLFPIFEMLTIAWVLATSSLLWKSKGRQPVG